MSNWQTQGYVPDSEGEDDEDILETQTEDVVEAQMGSLSEDLLRRQAGIAALYDSQDRITLHSAGREDQVATDLSIYDFPSDDTPVSTSTSKRKSEAGSIVTNTNIDTSEDYRIAKKAKTQEKPPLIYDGVSIQNAQVLHEVRVQDPEMIGIDRFGLVRQSFHP